MSGYTPPNFEDFEYKIIYISELWFYAYGIKSKTAQLDKLTQPTDDEYAIYNLPEITDLVLGILSNAANIKKLMSPSPRKNKEPAWSYTFRVDRSNMIKEFVSDLDISEIMNSTVRNSLEHFDEYLDEFSTNFMKGTIQERNPYITFNMAISELNTFQPHAYPVRQYCVKEKTYYNMDKSINIGKVFNEAVRIHQRCMDLKQGLGNNDYPTGMILVCKGSH
ncbi:TPA: hypothetical protein ACXP3B_003888 [Klebsiella pneumoniae]|uniref:hypothetical protein n=1 Tax=Klebsiella pneumoniae TaxID=573 RepID=UPI00192BE988|nr:hypothetical protein [Klebsiella pneumoniae]MBL4443040.1 hypothetical protein [Klebsiella pneumoniae]